MDQRAPGRYLKVVKSESHRDSGHFDFHCRIEDVDDSGNVMQGPIVIHGIDTPTLNAKHGGKHRNFLLNEVKPLRLKHYEDWIQDGEEAKELEGQSL